MSAPAMNSAQFYAQLQSNLLYNIEPINGKWFVNGVERDLFGKGSIYSDLVKIYPGYLGDPKKWRDLLNYLESASNDYESEWPKLPILKDAEDLIAQGYKPEKLAYPLNNQELKILHYLLDSDEKDTYMIFFYGVGGSGKSTICNIFTEIFGKKDVSFCPFHQIGEKFARETLAGKRIWFDDDINPVFTQNANSLLKKITTHGFDQFEKKGMNPYMAQYRCKPLFCCNKIPKFDLTDTGLLRRILYYAKNEPIQNPDGSLANKKYTYEELLDIVVAALLTDMTDWDIEFKKGTLEILKQTNPILKIETDNYDTFVIEYEVLTGRNFPYGREYWNEFKESIRDYESKIRERV